MENHPEGFKIKKRCPYCHTEMDIHSVIGKAIYCQCGAYAEMRPLSDANQFLGRAKKAFGIDPVQKGRFIEVVDGGIVFEEKNEPVIMLWARKPRASH